MKPAALALAATLAAFPVFAGEPEIFRNPTARLELTKPADWHFMTADQNQANLAATEFSDAELKAQIAKYATVPMVVIVKHREPYPDLNPSFKINMRPLGQLPADDPKAIMTALVPMLQRVSADAKVVDGPREVQVDGLKGAYLRIDYTLRTAEGGAYPTASELWIVLRGEYMFMIGGGTRQDEKTGTRVELRSIVDSLKLNR